MRVGVKFHNSIMSTITHVATHVQFGTIGYAFICLFTLSTSWSALVRNKQASQVSSHARTILPKISCMHAVSSHARTILPKISCMHASYTNSYSYIAY